MAEATASPRGDACSVSPEHGAGVWRTEYTSRCGCGTEPESAVESWLAAIIRSKSAPVPNLLWEQGLKLRHPWALPKEVCSSEHKPDQQYRGL